MSQTTTTARSGPLRHLLRLLRPALWSEHRARATHSGGGTDPLRAAMDRWQSLSGALETVIIEGGDGPVAAPTVELAIQVGDAAADTVALVEASQPQPHLARPADLLHLLHLMRHELAQHADRIADLTNAGRPLSAATNVEVAKIRRLLERIVAEVLQTTSSPDGPT